MVSVSMCSVFVKPIMLNDFEGLLHVRCVVIAMHHD